MGAIVVIGGYGNAGRPIVELLLHHSDRPVVVAGRNLFRAEAFATSLADPRVTAARCHQFDIQIGSAKNAGLRGLDGRARESGVCIVTDCGFQPGVPAAMVRAAAADRPDLARAVVSSWIALDWAALGGSRTARWLRCCRSSPTPVRGSPRWPLGCAEGDPSGGVPAAGRPAAGGRDGPG